MEERELLRKINGECEDRVPDVFNKIMLAATAQGLFDEETVSAEEYQNGNAKVLGGVNGKAVAITSLAAVAAVSLAIALPIALSGTNGGGLPGRELADIGFGDTYSVGAVTAARLAESMIDGSAAKPAALTVGSEDDIEEFSTYFAALDCLIDDGFTYQESLPTDKYAKSVKLSGSRADGTVFSYSMYYTEYRVLDKLDDVEGPVNYVLEGVITVSDRGSLVLSGERQMSSSAADAKENYVRICAYPDAENKNNYSMMQLISAVDGVPTRLFAYDVVKDGYIVSSAEAQKSDEALVISLKEEDEKKGEFTVVGKNEDGSYKVDYKVGGETVQLNFTAKSDGFEYVAPSYFEGFDYRDNGDGTYSVSGVLPDTEIPETLVIPAHFNGKPVVGVTQSAFYNKGLKKVVLEEGITKIESGAFGKNEELTSVTLPSTLTEIGGTAFWMNPNLSEVNLSEGLISIGNSAFSNCPQLTSITLPEGLETIGSFAFLKSGLASVNIPASVTKMEGNPFAGNTALTSVTVAAGNTVYRSEENCIIETAAKTLVTGCKTSVVPADGSVTVIGEYAFNEVGLTEFNLPANIKKIENGAFANNGFTAITMSAGIEEICAGAFSECRQLQSVVFNEGLKTLAGAFNYCVSLESVHLPASVTSVGQFPMCDGITELSVAAGNTVYRSAGNCIIEKSTGTVVLGCKTSVIPEDETVTKIGDGAFLYVPIAHLTIPSNITEIGEAAFSHSKLEELVIPDSVTKIGNSSFQFCTEITTLTLSNNLKEIADSAFTGCTGLTALTIPSGVEVIGAGTFAECGMLEEIYIPKTVTEIAFVAFERSLYEAKINYEGTSEEWEAVKKDFGWDAGCEGYVVNCLGDAQTDIN